MLKQLFVLSLLLYMATCDMYLHNPRGSNNRLNEASTNRQNNNRMCDTQNNAKGGYSYGPYMYYYVNSVLQIEWTNQHGCGQGHEKVLCQIILQYMCGDEVRDGTTTQSIPDNENTYNEQIANPEPGYFFGNDLDGVVSGFVFRYGMHESYQYYQDCKQRSRNRGLFIADRNVGGAAINTRQNNGGGRSGFECPEERDYYPYWHPSPWKDIAVMVDDTSRCTYYKQESQNSNGKNYCSNPRGNNEASCLSLGGTWERVGSWGGRDVDCVAADHTRVNHLGNARGLNTNTYRWRIPDDPHPKCVFRIRYNISTEDYNGWKTFADKNGVASPVKQDPYVNYYDSDDPEQNLTLAIDTSQFGRTFQDRSHVFEIRSRSSRLKDLDRVYNLNVRGKRGNIVQTYPATEYDYVPTHLHIKQNDFIHFQWTGANTNPNGNDGEGRAGTDRSNLIVYDNARTNHLPEFEGGAFFGTSDRYLFAYLGQTNCLSLAELRAVHGNNNNAIAQDLRNCMVLNAASPYFDGGLHKADTAATYRFICSRNNNFTNRSQKGKMTVDPFLPVWAIVLTVLAGVICLSAIVVSIVGFTARLMPDTKFGQAWRKINFLKDDDLADAVDTGAGDD